MEEVLHPHLVCFTGWTCLKNPGYGDEMSIDVILCWCQDADLVMHHDLLAFFGDQSSKFSQSLTPESFSFWSGVSSSSPSSFSCWFNAQEMSVVVSSFHFMVPRNTFNSVCPLSHILVDLSIYFSWELISNHLYWNLKKKLLTALYYTVTSFILWLESVVLLHANFQPVWCYRPGCLLKLDSLLHPWSCHYSSSITRHLLWKSPAVNPLAT